MEGEMDIWQTLGIEPTENIEVIKRAFAAKSKECHPEEHPEEYQKLRQAYKSASGYAKRMRRIAEQASAQSEPPQASEQPQSELRQDSEPEQSELQQASEQSSAQSEPPQASESAQTPLEPRQVSEQTAPSQPLKTEEKTDSFKPPKQEEEIYSYEEVKKAELTEVEVLFFYEFSLLANNPHIKNKKACWNVFLCQPKFKDIYYGENFCHKLVEVICRINGWNEETLIYFEGWMEQYQKAGQRATDSGLWKKKKNRSRRTIRSSDNAAIQEIHQAIMERLETRSETVNLDDERTMAAYIQYFYMYMSGRLRVTKKPQPQPRRTNAPQAQSQWTNVSQTQPQPTNAPQGSSAGSKIAVVVLIVLVRFFILFFLKG